MILCNHDIQVHPSVNFTQTKITDSLFDINKTSLIQLWCHLVQLTPAVEQQHRNNRMMVLITDNWWAVCTVQSVHCIGQVTLNTTSFTFLTGPESWALVCHRIPLLNQNGMEAFLCCMELVLEKDFRNLHAHALISIKCVS